MEAAGQKLILVIDDDRDILEAIRIMLETAGFGVETAIDSMHGLAKVKETNPNLIIVDMMMETVDAGVKVTEELKNTGCSAPILLLSSIGEATSYNLDIASMGFAGVIQKPVMPSVLIPLIRRKLNIPDK
ncbi:MAG TPA: response regulator [archaeon]|nr:response regulator [archaeon]